MESTGTEERAADAATLQRSEGNGHRMITNAVTPTREPDDTQGWRALDAWTVPCEPGNERQVIQRLGETVVDLRPPDRRLEALKTAVGEATMNAMEHGSRCRPELTVTIQVRAAQSAISMRSHVRSRRHRR
jgi:Histidine kinase-like ATPase domain